MYYINQSNLLEAEDLLKIQKECFKDDFLLYHDIETSPYVQSLKEMQKDISEKNHYTIFEEKKIIGAIVLKTKVDQVHIYKMFIESSHQNSGIGQKIILELFNTYKDFPLWSVYTPHKNYRNHHFYEKLGFVKYGEVKESDDLTLYKYSRVVL